MNSDFDDETKNLEEFGEVEQILNYREVGDGLEYLIKWKGCSTEENCWIPEKNLGNCGALIKSYEDTLKLRYSISKRKSKAPIPAKKPKTAKKSDPTLSSSHSAFADTSQQIESVEDRELKIKKLMIEAMRHFDQKLPAEALDKCKEAIQMSESLPSDNPAHVQLHFFSARCYFALDRFQEAYFSASTSLSYNPAFVIGLIIRSKALLKIGIKFLAEADLRNTLKLEPKNILALRAIRELRPVMKLSRNFSMAFVRQRLLKAATSLSPEIRKIPLDLTRLLMTSQLLMSCMETLMRKIDEPDTTKSKVWTTLSKIK